ncbi:DUF937 domain-containing protein [Hymenobacter sp. BT491]|uniref:DUF937 domain-containing protein n=1 Tax=Hymenobacter sp. BT491 TaxID=2766779 RepID=UPI001653A355|nr:DUF937 domain-containing protein [Hymenobacter sp. BT491]MBC6988865.1 DUF937 domain-containing protein [Hymenobacter sp. BT491]
MSLNLLDKVTSSFKGEPVRLAIATVGGSEAGVENALGRAIPLVLDSFIDLAQQPGGTEVLWSMTREAKDAGILPNLGKLISTNSARLRRGTELMQSLLDDRYASTVEAIARAAGLTSVGVSKLLGITVPVTLGVLGSYIAEQNLSAAGLGRWLQSQKNNVVNGLAPEIGASPPWATNAAANFKPVVRDFGDQPDYPIDKSKSSFRAMRWLALATVIIAIVGVAYALGRRDSQVVDKEPIIVYETAPAAPTVQPVNRITAAVPAPKPAPVSASSKKKLAAVRWSKPQAIRGSFRVLPARAYFYDEPKTMPSNGRYLAKGDVIVAEQESNGFLKTRYLNANKEPVAAWLKIEDLAKVAPYKAKALPAKPKPGFAQAVPVVSAKNPVATASKNAFDSAGVTGTSAVVDAPKVAVIQTDTAYFFTGADLMHQRKAFCIKGDRITLGQVTDDAIFATFVNWKKQKTSGWMSKDALGY